ncbi:hypothetical protein BU17DRAFT_103682 [Hysterangium stoloniferum]|nr:hypothetical protein BU17DRAFT_103682 [Hysterangium stoloniferum]
MPPPMMGLSSTARPASSRLSFTARPAEGSTQMHVTTQARVRSHPISGKEGEPFTNGSGAIAVAPIPTPEHLLPERKPSYKALMREPCIGKLEAFLMAFGKVTSGNRADKYDTASEDSHEDVAPSAATEVKRPADTPRTTLPPSISVVALKNEVTEKMKSSCQVLTEGKASGGQDATPASISQISDMLPPDAPSDPTASNPFALKATTQNSFGPRHQREEDVAIVEQNNVFEGDVPVLTESSNEDISKQSPQKRASMVALECRRQAMLVDVDASIVESRRIKCGICERWMEACR